MAWKPMSQVFRGGSTEAAALRGRRVRLRSNLTVAEYRGDGLPLGELVTRDLGEIGLVGGPASDQLDSIIVAFPPAGMPCPATIDALMRLGRFTSVLVNWPTFQFQFEIESA